MKESFWARLARVLNTSYGLDLRSLALFRVGLALLILGDLVLRSRDLKVFYTDWGALPRGPLIEKFANTWHISLHLMNGTLPFQAFLFGLAGIFALALLVGYRTKLASIVCWVLLISLQARNPVILQGGDVLFRMLAFWGMFLPLGACYSVDSALNTSNKRLPVRVLSGGSIGLLLQIVMLYWFSVALKSGAEWRSEGSAAYYALNIDQLVTPIGHALLQFPDLLRVMSFLVFWTEGLAPAFLIFPLWVGPVRTFSLYAIILMHMGFSLGLKLGHFPWVDLVSLLAFFPTWFWERHLQWIKTPARRGLKIYYDGDCGFCKKLVYLLRMFFLIPETQVQPAQNDPGLLQEMEAQNSWIVEDAGGQHYYKFHALLAVFQHSFLLWPLVSVLSLAPCMALGTRLYEAVARNRATVSKYLAWLSFRRVRIHKSCFFNGLAVFLTVYIFWWNLGGLNKRFQIPEPIRWVGPLLQIDQYWNMFAPFPLKNDGWYVIAGQLKNGKPVDVFRGGGPVRWEKPTDVSNMYRNERWRKYLMNLSNPNMTGYRLYYGQYLCRLWNTEQQRSPSSLLDTFEIYFMQEITLPNYQTPRVEKKLLWRHYCFAHSS